MDYKTLISIIPDETPAVGKLPANYERDKEAGLIYQKMTDEEMLDLVREFNEIFGTPPKKHDLPGFQYFKSRFGPWPRMLERAGVKELGAQKQRRMEAKKRKHKGGHKKKQQHQQKNIADQDITGKE